MSDKRHYRQQFGRALRPISIDHGPPMSFTLNCRCTIVQIYDNDPCDDWYDYIYYLGDFDSIIHAMKGPLK